MTNHSNVLAELEQVLRERKAADPEKSYVASLYAKGDDTVLRKVCEEATEFLLAAKNDQMSEMTSEGADLLFHFLVALSHKGVALDAVLSELSGRFGLSGLEEKAARPKQ